MTIKKDKTGLTEKEFLRNYRADGYEKPSVSTDILVLGTSPDLKNMRILLVKRDEHPFLDMWSLPGGFVHQDETAYQAAARVLSQKAGIENTYLDQIYTFTRPGRDPRTWVMSIAYLALVSDARDEVVDGTYKTMESAWFDMIIDQDEIRFVNQNRHVEIKYSIESKSFKNGRITYENLVSTPASKEQLAFDHIEIIIESFLKLKAEFEHTDLSFNMIGEKFTLPDLQAVYELVLGRKLYKTNFRALVAPKIEATCEKRKSIISNKMSAEYRYIG